MKRSRISENQIIKAIKDIEAGVFYLRFILDSYGVRS